MYYVIIWVAALFNPKAKKWIEGRENIFTPLKNSIQPNDEIYWFHCASLGEFEQGKPIIDELKSKNKSIRILVTFFSPSGYELRKDYENADYVFYLPLDTPKNAHQFIKIVQPKKAFFIKYEFWYNYLFELHQHKIPTYLISGVFRKEQAFFKWHGILQQKMLTYFTHFFVQNKNSEELLQKIGYTNITVTGDTRIDRVYENTQHPINIPLIKKFKEKNQLLVAGSSWKKEEEILAEHIHFSKKDFKYIIAPHDVSNTHIKKIEKLLKTNYLKYSDATTENIKSVNTLIIDSIGILANIYQYSDIAFIGGGFTGALHNVLEPASFGNVILFGPKHKKFHEAEELMKQQAAFEVKDADDLLGIVNHLTTNQQLENSQQAALNYIETGIGATQLILKELLKLNIK